jgi:nucleotide-binding universal stress UspA family protein
MKKLLVLTDFTPNAAHAAAAALRLCSKLNTDILLYHALPFIPLIPSDSGGIYVNERARMLFEDSQERLSQEAADFRKRMADLPGRHPVIDTGNGEGALGDVIGDLTNDPNIEMVIMGGRSGGALDHLLSGSDTGATIRKSGKPVLIIPMKAPDAIFKKVVFATDFGTSDIAAVNYLLQLSKRLGFRLDVVHVLRHGEVVTELGPELAFRKFLAQHALNCNQVFSEDVHGGLRHYCAAQAADLLAMTHGHHSFISRLFGHSESREAISDQQLAVLVFPPVFK